MHIKIRCLGISESLAKVCYACQCDKLSSEHGGRWMVPGVGKAALPAVTALQLQEAELK